MIATVIWGSLGLPLLITLVLLVLARVAPSKGLAPWLTGSAPAWSLAGSWWYFLGTPDWEAFSGNDWILVFTPLLALAWGVSGSSKLRAILAVVAAGTLVLFLKPLDPTPYLLLVVGAAYLVWIGLGGVLFRGGGSQGRAGEFALSSVAAFTAVAWLIVMWGSASQAQIVGGLTVAVGVFVALYLIGFVVSNDLALGWMWIWFFWQGLNAHFYMDVPWWFLLGPAVLMISARYGPHIRFNSRINYQGLVARVCLLAIAVMGIAWAAFAFKPKSFY